MDREDKILRIAVAAKGNGISAEIGPNAGRASFYLVFNESGTLLESLSNPYADAERGAGRKAALLLAQNGIDVLIAGRIGGAMSEDLSAFWIRFIEKVGRASKAAMELG